MLIKCSAYVNNDNLGCTMKSNDFLDLCNTCWDYWGMGAHGAYRRPREKEWRIREDFVGLGTQTAVC
jgi:hypothetical protein